ncbi:transcription elongation factor SPT5 isoform X2 [Drosophila guanche]|uniref:transcription elongation factor SPT5 isoform X2 n=1 Tax=Drosophila guanche TaxID=7266 RepID=UPI0014711010|nr:transcription elongation factor SPT5 isoform X2 [Drosophila guanche]
MKLFIVLCALVAGATAGLIRTSSAGWGSNPWGGSSSSSGWNSGSSNNAWGGNSGWGNGWSGSSSGSNSGWW